MKKIRYFFINNINGHITKNSLTIATNNPEVYGFQIFSSMQESQNINLYEKIIGQLCFVHVLTNIQIDKSDQKTYKC